MQPPSMDSLHKAIVTLQELVTAPPPSKRAGSDSHPVRSGLEALARSGPMVDDSCTQACFWAGSRIRSGLVFAQYDPGHLWKNAAEFESGKLVVGWLHSTRTGHDHSCTLACFQTGCFEAASKPDQAIQIRSRPGPSLEEWNRIGCGSWIRHIYKMNGNIKFICWLQFILFLSRISSLRMLFSKISESMLVCMD